MKCPNCGKEIANDSNFCEFCGAKVEVRGTQVIDRATMPINSQVGGAGNATQRLDRVKTPVAAAPSPSSPKKEEPKRKKGWLWIVVGIVGILLIGLIVMLSGNEEEPVFDMVENPIDSSYVDQSDELEPTTIDGQSGASVQADSLMIPASSAKQETKQIAPLLEAESQAKMEKVEVQEETEVSIKPQRKVPSGYVDLGLKSGTLWKENNEAGFYTYDEAMARFGKKLPTLQQWEELKDKCKWKRNGSQYRVTGPNGNSITLPAAGSHDCLGAVAYVGQFGSYWSSTPDNSEYIWYLATSPNGVGMLSTPGCNGHSIRLVQ